MQSVHVARKPVDRPEARPGIHAAEPLSTAVMQPIAGVFRGCPAAFRRYRSTRFRNLFARDHTWGSLFDGAGHVPHVVDAFGELDGGGPADARVAAMAGLERLGRRCDRWVECDGTSLG